MPPSPPSTIAVTAILLVSVSCAGAQHGARRPPRDVEPPEVFVDVVPRGAVLAVDGVVLGQGGRTVAVTDPHHVYVFDAAAPGFVPAQRSDVGERLAGTRVALVLVPAGYAGSRPPDLDDVESLASAGAALLRMGRGAAALEFAERAVEASPRAPLAHRVLADAALAVGRRDRAIDEYGAYLRLAPDALDRVDIEHRIAVLGSDQPIPGVQVGNTTREGGGPR